jgi:nucleoside-diphosphate-sugar epimerase
MRYVVTGGCGFIGSNVVAALREAGHEAVAVDCLEGADRRVDICDTTELQRVLVDCCPQAVFHIAAIADARKALADPVQAVQINIGGTASVFEAARQAGVGRVILASTCWVAAAMGPGIIDENEPFLPTGGGHIYTSTKIAGELIAHDFYELYKLPFTILRYGIPYGPGMWSGLVLRAFFDRAAEGKPLTVFGDGSASRRFLYVKDLAEAHVLALQEVAVNQTYNLEGMRAVTIRELAERTARLLGGIEVVYQEAPPTRVGELQYFRKIISNAKAYVDLGWEPKTDLDVGIREAIAWYHRHVAPLPGCETLVRE